MGGVSLDEQAKIEAQRAAIKKYREEHLTQVEAKNASQFARRSSSALHLAAQFQAAMPAPVCLFTRYLKCTDWNDRSRSTAERARISTMSSSKSFVVPAKMRLVV